MHFRIGCLKLTVLLFAGEIFLQLRDVNGIPLVTFQEEFVYATTPVLSESFSTTAETTAEPRTSSTPVMQPTSEEPPCWKKLKEITEFIEFYAMLDIPLADISKPDCDSKGYYKPLQCHFGGCQCVDRLGEPTSELEDFGLDCSQTDS